MKILFTLFLLLISIFTSALYAQEISLPHITVYGTAVIEVVPDKMLWNIRVMNRGQSLENVTKNHSQIVSDVIRFLEKSGAGEDLQTSRMQFGENWVFRQGTRVKEGYFAQTSVSFSMTDFNVYRDLWLGLSRFESVSVLNVEYDHTEKIRYQNETRVKALQEAREKATILAESIGSGIAEPLLIEEEAGDHMLARSVAAEFRLDASDSSSAISPGLITIRMRIKASFRLVNTE